MRRNDKQLKGRELPALGTQPRPKEAVLWVSYPLS